MIPRKLASELLAQLSEFPVVTVLGPRQAGKTTLVRATLPDFDYVSLEHPETRSYAEEDPQAFLKAHNERVIFDEIQRCPQLLSYLQVIVDERTGNGQFVLTGSHQLELRAAISQSLAGRTGMLHLLPLSMAEMAEAGIALASFEDYAFSGFLPRVHAEHQRPAVAYRSYYETYVERDVRQIIRLKDATLFEKLIKLLAGRTGQVINYQSLSNDIGVDAKTVKQWLSILEASFVIFSLTPYFENFGKRVIKSPKIYFTDTGLLTHLLGIDRPDQVRRDPLVGQIFENLVVLEALKARYNQARSPNLYFFRDSNGIEIDLLYKSGSQLTGIEIKSAATYNAAFKRGLQRFAQNYTSLAHAYIVYNGEARAFSDGVASVNYAETAVLFEDS